MIRSTFFDPFYTGADEQMRQMDQMFQFPGQMGRRHNGMALSDGRHQRQHAQNMQVAGHGMFMDPFANFGSMFSNMQSMMADMRSAFDGAQSNGNGQVFQQSSFMSYSNTGDGAPKIYQASSSSQQGPDGLRETRKTVRDSESGVNRIAVGHHIMDRGHVVEHSRNSKTGEANENQEYINLDEDEAPTFDQEYRDKWHSTMRGVDQRRHAERSRHAPVAGHRRHAALPEPETRHSPYERKVNFRRE